MCSFAQAQQEIETGRVEIPDDGIFIKSARLSAQRGSDVYFKLQHVKATSDHDKPLQVLDSLQAGYLNILSIFRRVRLPETLAAAKKVADGEEGAAAFGNAYAYAERLIHGCEHSFCVLSLLSRDPCCMLGTLPTMGHLIPSN